MKFYFIGYCLIVKTPHYHIFVISQCFNDILSPSTPLVFFRNSTIILNNNLNTASMTSKFLPLLAVKNCYLQGDQKIWKTFAHFLKSSTKSLQGKKGQSICNKAQFESPKHLHQTTFETLKYLQQTMFWNCLFRWKCNKFSTAKSIPKSPFI